MREKRDQSERVRLRGRDKEFASELSTANGESVDAVSWRTGCGWMGGCICVRWVQLVLSGTQGGRIIKAAVWNI